jgi:ketosteroid isomerase-like protein
MTAEDRIRALIEDRTRATAGQDAAALSDHHAADAVLFDAVGPLRSAGTNAQAQRVAEWLSAYRGPIDYQIRDLEITAGEQVAFCHYLYRIGGTMTDGTVVGMWLRSTVCLRQAGQDWLVTHEHTSVPFDLATGAASLTLEP